MFCVGAAVSFIFWILYKCFSEPERLLAIVSIVGFFAMMAVIINGFIQLENLLTDERHDEHK